jgi:hypothetical protein
MSARNTLQGLLKHTIALLACLALSPLAAAENAPQSANVPTMTTWHCWYDGMTGVLCRISELATPSAATMPAQATATTTASIDSGRPQRGTLTQLAVALVDAPAKMIERTIRVPLLSYPENMSDVEELADAVVCGGRITCRVEFFRTTGALALHLDDESDPALH